MRAWRIWGLVLITALFPRAVGADEPKESPKIISVAKIWDEGEHNAFTDLIRWRDRFYCVFRESEAHVGGDGEIRVLASDDGEKWESIALIAEEGVDLRDPKLSITPDDRLMIVAGGSIYQGTTLLGRQPRVIFSENGRDWSRPKKVLSEGEWLWRVTWRDGKAYGISYNHATEGDWTLTLVSSNDGINYQPITKLDVAGKPNEATIRFLPDGEMLALVRREGGNHRAWIGESRPPYKEWRWRETSHRIGGPNFIQLPDGSLWAGGRSYYDEAKMVLSRMTRDDYDPVLTLPSGGDTSYPGFIWRDGLLWMSYYSSHEGKSSIYLAKIEMPLKANGR